MSPASLLLLPLKCTNGPKLLRIFQTAYRIKICSIFKLPTQSATRINKTHLRQLKSIVYLVMKRVQTRSKYRNVHTKLTSRRNLTFAMSTISHAVCLTECYMDLSTRLRLSRMIADRVQPRMTTKQNARCIVDVASTTQFTMKPIMHKVNPQQLSTASVS